MKKMLRQCVGLGVNIMLTQSTELDESEMDP